MLGALPGVIGTMQAMEALKILGGVGESLAGRLIQYDASATSFREIKLRPDPGCALCGESPTIAEPVTYGESCPGPAMGEVDAAGLLGILSDGFDGILLDVRERDEHSWAHLEGCRLAPLSEFHAHLPELPPDARYLVYCKVGQRSAHAASLMLEAGFQNVTNVQGGILGWIQAGGAVTSGQS